MSVCMLEARTCPITRLKLALQSMGMLGVSTRSCSPWAGWGCLLAFVVHEDTGLPLWPWECWGCPAALVVHMGVGLTGHPCSCEDAAVSVCPPVGLDSIAHASAMR